MKILHVSTGSSGGAWMTANRLSNQQRLAGLDSELLTLKDVQESQKFLKKSFYTLIRSINTLYSKYVAVPKFEFLSIYSTKSGLAQQIRNLNPDVIHVHNWFNILSKKELQNLGSRYPIVFSMHDSRLATGGCHIPHQCTGYQGNCFPCPATLTGKKRVKVSRIKTVKALNSINSFAIIAPSAWQMRQAVQSGITRKALVSKVIPNPHPGFVTLTGKKKSRSNTRVLFVAANLNSQIKNLKCLIEALKILKSDLIELNLVGFGAGPEMDEISSYTEVKFRGISSEEEIQTIMEECDLLVVPSKSENFPNVVLEAFASGLVVVAASVGGIPEMIDDQINGYLYDGSPEDLSKKLEYAITDKGNWEQLREKAKDKLNEEFSNVNISEEILEIYRMLIAAHKELNDTHVD